MSSRIVALLTCVLSTNLVAQDVSETMLPSIFGDHMVLQRDQAVPIWGWDKPGQEVTVTLQTEAMSDRAPRKLVGKADESGRWEVKVPATPTGGKWKVTVAGSKKIEYTNVVFGEVWICSGQSNMAWTVQRSNDADLEIAAARFPNIRLISVPRVGVQEPQRDFNGQWAECSPETVAGFSAVGYFFGRQLHQTLDVPIGLINNAWGGSACEAWINRKTLEQDGRFTQLMDRWKKEESSVEENQKKFDQRLADWQAKAREARKAGKKVPQRPRNSPKQRLSGNQRPANIYNGVLKPTIGYGIRGAIWYQGESNANRAYQYRELFPLMIESWRKEWGQGDFSFYWVQLADFRKEVSEPSDSAWAELREAQSMTMKLPNTGQAVITDIGEGRDIHPRNKQDVAMRLARWALAKDYGMKDYRDKPLVHQSPTFKSMKADGKKVTLKFDHVGQGLYTFDVAKPIGFSIAGKDKVFHKAQGQLVRGKNNQVVIWSDKVPEPVAVRYAWADNPVANLYSRDGLPATPFRTDDWEGITAKSR